MSGPLNAMGMISRALGAYLPRIHHLGARNAYRSAGILPAIVGTRSHRVRPFAVVVAPLRNGEGAGGEASSAVRRPDNPVGRPSRAFLSCLRQSTPAVVCQWERSPPTELAVRQAHRPEQRRRVEARIATVVALLIRREDAVPICPRVERQAPRRPRVHLDEIELLVLLPIRDHQQPPAIG